MEGPPAGPLQQVGPQPAARHSPPSLPPGLIASDETLQSYLGKGPARRVGSWRAGAGDAEEALDAAAELAGDREVVGCACRRTPTTSEHDEVPTSPALTARGASAPALSPATPPAGVAAAQPPPGSAGAAQQRDHAVQHEGAAQPGGAAGAPLQTGEDIGAGGAIAGAHVGPPDPRLDAYLSPHMKFAAAAEKVI